MVTAIQKRHHSETIVMMTEREAKQAILSIKSSVIQIGQVATDIQVREGWKALGYGSFSDCIKHEFEHTWQHVYRSMTVYRVHRQIQDEYHALLESQVGEYDEGDLPPPPENLPTSWGAQLGQVPPEDQYHAFQNATQTAKAEGRDQPTADHIRRSVAQVKKRNAVFESDYKVVAHMMATDEITTDAAFKMTECLDAIKDIQVRSEVLNIIGTHGLSEPLLIPEIAGMYNRKPGQESKVLPVILNSGTLGGVLLKKASLTDLKNEKREAAAEHKAEALEEKRRKQPQATSEPMSMLGDKLDMNLMHRELTHHIEPDRLKELAQIIADQVVLHALNNSGTSLCWWSTSEQYGWW